MLQYGKAAVIREDPPLLSRADAEIYDL